MSAWWAVPILATVGVFLIFWWLRIKRAEDQWWQNKR